MKLPEPLVEGRLVRRYQRFLADVVLADGTMVTAHTPNTGSMTQCAVSGSRVFLSRAFNPKRKLAWTLELIEVNGCWVDINTLRANRVVEEGLRAAAINELAGYHSITPETYYRDSRIDFLLEGEAGRALVEVKSVTLCCSEGVACFPDAVTVRGQRHLRDLESAVAEGLRGVIFFLVQRSEARALSPADAIDPVYGCLLRSVVAQGVEVLAYRNVVTRQGVELGERLPVML